MVLFTDIKKRHKSLADFAYLIGILLICESQLAECAGGVDKIAWIYSYFLAGSGSCISGLWIEMHIRHKGYFAALTAQTAAYGSHIGCFRHSLRRETHNLSACLRDPERLPNGAFRIESACIGH